MQEGVSGISAMRRERCVTSSGDKTTRNWKILEETQLVFRGPAESFDCIDLLTEETWITGSQQGYPSAADSPWFLDDSYS